MKSMILTISVPLVCLAAGYGAGLFLVPAASPEPAAISDTAEAGDAATAAEAVAEEEDRPLLQIGRLTVPVLKTRSITYVVADIALSMSEPDLVGQVKGKPEALMRLRDAVLASLTAAAATPSMAGPAIDTDVLSAHVLADLAAIGMPVDEVLFPNLFKHDVARQDIPRRSAAVMPPATAQKVVTN